MTTMLIPGIAQAESAHWYLPNGEPFYEVPNKSKPGEMRAPTLRDARKVNAVPSVTGVLNIVEKKGLTNWKIEQAILASLTLPRLPDESDDFFARRAAEDAAVESRQAMEFGTRVHRGIERALLGKPPEPDDAEPFVDAFMEWYVENGADLRGCLVDFKTQNKPQGEPFRFYDEWLWQLAAYAEAIEPSKRMTPTVAGFNRSPLVKRERPEIEQTVASPCGFGGRIDYLWPNAGDQLVLASVVISSRDPGHILTKGWTPRERAWGWDVFRSILETWIAIKKYDPRSGA